jgi:hypothetical protein
LLELQQSGVQVKALENRPILLPGLDVYLKAYVDLSFDRPIGMSVGPIPWSSIIKWCQLHEIHDINEIETCVRFMRALEQKDSEIAERKKGVKE